MRNIQFNISGPKETVLKENNAKCKPTYDGKLLSEQLTEQMRFETFDGRVQK